LAVPEVRIFRTIQEIEELREIWTSWPGHRDSDLDFYLSFCAPGNGFLDPYVVVTYCDNRPTAMLIARRSLGSPQLKIGYINLWRPSVRTIGVVYGGFRGEESNDNCRALVGALKQSLKENYADIATIGPARVDSPLYLTTKRAGGFFGGQSSSPSDPHWRMTVPSTVDEFQSRLPSKKRKERRHLERMLNEDFKDSVKIHCFKGINELDRMMCDVEQIAAISYQRGLGVGFFNIPCLRKRFCLEAGKGWLRGYVLYAADIPCAFFIGSIYEQTFHIDFVGYREEYGKYSIGRFLLMKIIEGFCGGEENVREVDFGIGDAKYKKLFSTEGWMEGSLCMCGPSAKGVTIRVMTKAATSIDQLLKKGLQRTGLMQKVKKVWRMRAKHRTSGENP
jgi:hypothetical protein